MSQKSASVVQPFTMRKCNRILQYIRNDVPAIMELAGVDSNIYRAHALWYTSVCAHIAAGASKQIVPIDGKIIVNVQTLHADLRQQAHVLIRGRTHTNALAIQGSLETSSATRHLTATLWSRTTVIQILNAIMMDQACTAVPATMDTVETARHAVTPTDARTARASIMCR
jgi:hypothetical protein